MTKIQFERINLWWLLSGDWISISQRKENPLQMNKIFSPAMTSKWCMGTKIMGTYIQILIKENFFELDISPNHNNFFLIRGLISWGCISNSQRNENSLEVDKHFHAPWHKNDVWILISRGLISAFPEKHLKNTPHIFCLFYIFLSIFCTYFKTIFLQF